MLLFYIHLGILASFILQDIMPDVTNAVTLCAMSCPVWKKSFSQQFSTTFDSHDLSVSSSTIIYCRRLLVNFPLTQTENNHTETVLITIQLNE